MLRTLEITSTRREKQLEHNEKNNVTPRSVERAVQASLYYRGRRDSADPVTVSEALGDEDVAAVIAEIEGEMLEAAENLEFERAALLRDQVDSLRTGEFRKSEPSRPRRRSKRVHRGRSYRPRRR